MTTPVIAALSDLVSEWDQRPDVPFGSELFGEILAELLFHGDHRFANYRPHQSAGSFPVRLLAWLRRARNEEDRQVMLRLARVLEFMGDRELDALYIDAYRRVIKPWVLTTMGCDALYLYDVNSEYRLREVLSNYAFASITLSFSLTQFVQANELTSLPTPVVLGDTVLSAQTQVRTAPIFREARGCIIMEDFVGTGDQAGEIVAAVRTAMPKDIPIAFVPLVCLQRGEETLKDALNGIVTFCPVVTLLRNRCIGALPEAEEPDEFARFRRLIQDTASAVRSRVNRFDVAPSNAFGYKGSGALYVSSHNAPNNTIPLIHHQGARWEALFRRHHSKRNKKKAADANPYEDGLR